VITVDHALQPSDLLSQVSRLWKLSAQKIRALDSMWNPGAGAPVFTVAGRYTTRGWTEWTQGFQYGSSLLQFDATGDREFLRMGRENTVRRMASHVTHAGVHDHGFNNVSTYGALWRLMGEGRIEENPHERDFYELALKCSGAVQARRWTRIADGGGFIYSFNGPHSLFADTIRSLRSLALAHRLGHVLMDERDRPVSLLERLIRHAQATATYNVYYGEGRDAYDVRGRVAHESIFNVNDGSYRCPNSQQGYSPFTTWTRGLAWIMCGCAEELEFLETPDDVELEPFGGRAAVEGAMLRAARAACDFYIENTPTDGIPYWDTGAPGLSKLGDYLARPADPFNDFEPVDSSAAAIAAQGLLRLGHYLSRKGSAEDGARYRQAGLTVAKTLFGDPYLCADPNHQGLLLHSIYHRPNGWDYIPDGSRIPRGEASMWGDYHARELALYIQRLALSEPYYAFFGQQKGV
jgi:unsaturated chondroitin disaccharide hydrolase